MKRAVMCPTCKQVVRDTYTEELEEVVEAAREVAKRLESALGRPGEQG